MKKGEGQRQRSIVSSGRASERVPPGFIGMKNKVRSQSVGAILSSRLSSLPSSLALMTIHGHAIVTNFATVLLTLVFFFLLLLCEHRLGLIDSPGCQSFKRSSMMFIITSTPANKRPSPIRLPRKMRKRSTHLRSTVDPLHQSLHT